MTAETEQVETLVLRFRDLVTPSGDTIGRHQDSVFCVSKKITCY